MEILDPITALMTNTEVADLLESNIGGKSARRNRSQTRRKVEEFERKILKILKSSSYPPLPVDILQQLFTALEPFNLTKSELVQIANTPPRSLVELFAIVELMEERFPTPEEQERIFQVIKETVPKVIPKAANDNNNNNDDGENNAADAAAASNGKEDEEEEEAAGDGKKKKNDKSRKEKRKEQQREKKGKNDSKSNKNNNKKNDKSRKKKVESDDDEDDEEKGDAAVSGVDVAMEELVDNEFLGEDDNDDAASDS